MHQFGSPVRCYRSLLAAARANGISVLIAWVIDQTISIWFKRERFSPFEPIQGKLVALRSGDTVILEGCGDAVLSGDAQQSKIYVSNRKFINNANTCSVQAGKMRPNYGSLRASFSPYPWLTRDAARRTVNLSPLPKSSTS